MNPHLLPRVARHRQEDLVAEANRARLARGEAGSGRRQHRPAVRAARAAVGTRLIAIGVRLVEPPKA